MIFLPLVQYSPLPARETAIVLGLLMALAMPLLEPALDIPDQLRAALKKERPSNG